MVMLYDGKSAKKQLHPSYQGPFIVSGKCGSHGKSYTLKQINGTPIPGTFYGDHLNPFVPRIGHLVTGNEEETALHQNIRAKKGFHKLPQRLQSKSWKAQTSNIYTALKSKRRPGLRRQANQIKSQGLSLYGATRPSKPMLPSERESCGDIN
ncbi:hypothetical protein K3495_g9686 [Podosphaera aphanis]|nr:hypothetical protein K3495_g9686 [Podosphaera aphanis]